MSLDIRATAAALERDLSSILAMAERVVNIDSGSYHAAGVNAVIDVWAEMLRGMGFAVERVPLDGRGDQMTARLTLGGNGPRVLSSAMPIRSGPRARSRNGRSGATASAPPAPASAT